MVSLQRILCPTDFSETSRHALQHAIAIAKWYDSRIAALHVVQPVFILQPPILFAEMASGTVATDREAVEQQLRTWVAPAEEARIPITMLVEDGNAAARILDRAASLPADLIVMGTHGLGGFERLLLGSVAEKVLRKARCPVLTVPPHATTTAAVPYRRLICAVDFSEPSLAALRFAYSIAEEADAHLTILHVFDWPSDDDFMFARADALEFQRVVEGDVHARLGALVTDDVRTWCDPWIKVDHGKPYRRILAAAEAEHADLIVMGVRGRNPLDLALFGSTANHVVRSAACPVLTLSV